MVVYDVQDVTKYYPGRERPANDGINLQIRKGEIFGILGDNGAGKTTLVRQMVNLLQPTTGEISLLGRPVSADGLHVPAYVGYMPQETHALNNLTVGEALYFTAHLRGLSRAAARQERDRLLQLWQMEGLYHKNSARLSGGQRRLLRLAVAMAGAMPVLILDEPTNDLAPQRRRLVWEVLSRVNRELGTTIIFITHDAIEAERAIQRVGILRDGRLVALGRPADLKKAVDRKLGLELFAAPDACPPVPPGLNLRQVQPGRWIALVDRGDAGGLLNHLDLGQIEDFHLYSATLEDLYVYYVTGPGA